MKLAWRRKTGAESDADSSELPGRVLRGAMMVSSSMLKGKLARLRASIVGIEIFHDQTRNFLQWFDLEGA